MSLENLFPRSFTTKRGRFSKPLHEAFVRGDNSEANAVHFGRHIERAQHEIYSDMSSRDIIAMLSR